MISEKVSKMLICKRWLAIQRPHGTGFVINPSNFESIHLDNNHIIPKNCFIQKCLSRNVRQFHTSTKNMSYFTTELNYARKVMGDLEPYSDCLAESLTVKENLDADVENIIAKQWISMNNTEILNNFELLSNYVQNNIENESMEDSKYRGIIDIISSRCADFTDKELHHLMSCLSLWNAKKTGHAFQSICKAIDAECMKRMPNWSVNEIFMTQDQFYKLRIARVSEFTWHSLRKLNLKLKKLTPPQLVQFAFLLKVNREIPMNLYNLEYYVEENFDKFTLEEFAIIAMPFDKYATPIRSKNFLIRLLKKFTSDINNASDITFTLIMKIIR